MEILIIQLSFASSLSFLFVSLYLPEFVFFFCVCVCACVCVFKFKIVHDVRSDAKYRNKW